MHIVRRNVEQRGLSMKKNLQFRPETEKSKKYKLWQLSDENCWSNTMRTQIRCQYYFFCKIHVLFNKTYGLCNNQYLLAGFVVSVLMDHGFCNNLIIYQENCKNCMSEAKPHTWFEIGWDSIKCLKNITKNEDRQNKNGF